MMNKILSFILATFICGIIPSQAQDDDGYGGLYLGQTKRNFSQAFWINLRFNPWEDAVVPQAKRKKTGEILDQEDENFNNPAAPFANIFEQVTEISDSDNDAIVNQDDRLSSDMMSISNSNSDMEENEDDILSDMMLISSSSSDMEEEEEGYLFNNDDNNIHQVLSPYPLKGGSYAVDFLQTQSTMFDLSHLS